MNAFFILVICCIIAVASMLVVTYANQKEKKSRLIRQRLKYLRLRVDDLEELVIELGQLVESKAIARAINDEIIDLLNDMIKLDPSATYLNASLINAEQRMEELNDESEATLLQRLRESDAKIAKTQHRLTEASKVLRRQQLNGKLSLEEYNLFVYQLGWSHLMVDVVSHVAQGHKAMNRGDVLNAHAFYKRAQQSLIHSAHTDPRRHRMIKELTELLTNRRRALSEELMPETQYNPNNNEGTSFKADAPQATEDSADS